MTFFSEFYEPKLTQFSSREISKDTALRAVTALKLKVTETQLKSPKKSEKVEKIEEKPKNLEIGSKCEDLPICQICEEGENDDSEENSDEKVEKRTIFQCTGECRLGSKSEFFSRLFLRKIRQKVHFYAEFRSFFCS